MRRYIPVCFLEASSNFALDVVVLRYEIQFSNFTSLTRFSQLEYCELQKKFISVHDKDRMLSTSYAIMSVYFSRLAVIGLNTSCTISR